MGFTIPTVPTEGSTTWYAWATAVDTAARGAQSASDVATAAASAAAPVLVTQTLSANGPAAAFDASVGDAFLVKLSANSTLATITNSTAGQTITISWAQDAAGGHNFSWPTTCKFAGGLPPTDTAAQKRTTVTFLYDGTSWFETARAVAVG